ncbi:MAG: hypothetical protein ABJE95_02095 [Byssovorax sp.]
MTPRSLVAAALAGLAAASCSAVPPINQGDPAPHAPVRAASRAPAARWLVPDGDFVEHTPEGLDRVVAGGRRLELRGLDVVTIGPRSPEIESGAVAPPWAGEGPQRYVFWKGRVLYGAATFTGELAPIAKLPSDPRGSFDWIGGVGLLLAGGAAVIAPRAPGLAPLPIAAASHGVAADARRAIAVDVLGRASLTLDGGATFRDVSIDLGAAPRLEIRGEAIVATLRDGRESFVLASGEIVTTHAARRPARDQRAEPEPDAWPRAAGRTALEAAVSSGLPLADGGAVIVGKGFVGRLDLVTLRVTSVAPIPIAADCAPIRQGAAVLLACADRERAMILDVTGAPRIERTFDQRAPRDRDRFVGDDDGGIGFLGPCDPTTTIAAALPDDPAASPGRSAYFCARASRDAWIEHHLDPDDAGALFAWIPRPGGGAVALVARPGTAVPEAERVTVRGALRIVRVARSEPPLSFPTYAHRQAIVLDRAFHASADDTLEGWLPAASAAAGQLAVTLDPRGHVRSYPAPPRATPIHAAGAFALVASDDDGLFETTDRGHTWIAVEPPPGAGSSSSSNARCSAVGCRTGPFVRLGWSSPSASPPPARSRGRAPGYARTLPPSTRVALRCHATAPAEGRRSPDSNGFGFTTSPAVRGQSPIRLGAIGSVQMPWNGSLAVTQGDAEIAWISPLDPSGVVHRVTLSLSAPGLGLPSQRAYEARLGYLLDPRGDLALFPTGRREACLDHLLDRAGVTRPIGGCAGDLSVGVDLGASLFLVQPSSDSVILSTADSPSRAAALRELQRVSTAPTRGFSFGVGSRDGAPMLVAVDVLGEALLAPITPATGTLGPSERLRSLTALALGGDAVCKGPSPTAEARVVLPFESLIGLDRGALPGLLSTGTGGVAVIRWSRERACLDAVELAIRDERYDPELSSYDPPSSARRLVARFGAASGGMRTGAVKAPTAALVEIGAGSELRQPIECDGVGPAAVESPFTPADGR